MQRLELSKKPKFTITYIKILIVLWIGLIALFAVLSDGVIIKPSVLFGLTENVVEVGLMALALTYIITTGGIDLSVGSTMALSAIMLGMTYENTNNIGLAIVVCLLTGLACGALNGIIIAKTGVSPLVTTLATMSLYYGIARIISGTKIFSTYPDGFKFLGYKRLFSIVPYQFIFFVFVFIMFAAFFYRANIGRYLRAIGHNEKAAKFMGVSVGKNKFFIYTLTGLLCSLASIIYLSRLPAAKPDIGLNLNLEAITAVVLGGTNIMGGTGSVTGTFIAVLVLGVLRKGLQLVGLGGSIYNFILGILLIISLISFSYLDHVKKKKR
ncbi:MAG: transporter permease [Bacilli bacterium]|nr:transporter permease [Bacilli bacterium]